MVASRTSRDVRVLSFTIAFLSALALPPGIAQTTVAGFTPGNFHVSESGAATYSIPIQVPPGTAGMEPKLAFTYNSKGGNGLLGMGWGLSGLSAITRCSRTQAQDGMKLGVNYGWNDRYCLDGQRLVMVTGAGAAYGTIDTEYRTERETFTKVVAYGIAGNGPAWFKVWTKAGQVLEYGNTDDSRIEAQGKTSVRVWALNKISDRKGNYLTVAYAEDNTNGDFHPARIDYNYTGTPPTANASVQFLTAGRPDVAPAYVAGSVVKTLKRVTNVKTYVGTNPVKDYRLAYSNTGSTARSKLVSLQECSGDGENCVPATTFDWQQGVDGSFTQASTFNLTDTLLSYTDNTVGSLLGDFDGDGKTDILRWSANADNALYRSNGDGSFTQATTFNLNNIFLSHSNHTRGSLLGDFNGDGRTDILRWWDDPANNALFLSNGDGSFTQAPAFNLTSTLLSHSNNSVGILLGDFNGDGRTDILRWWDNPANNAVFLSNGDGSFTQAPAFNLTSTLLDHGNGTVGSLLGDFNGDGKTDILRWWNDPANNALFLSDGNGSFTQAPAFNIGTLLGHSTNQVGSLLGDFNGDGKTDILTWWNTYANNALFLSNGDGSFTQAPAFNLKNILLAYSDYTVGSKLGDFNGDGKTDILRWSAQADNTLYLSNGDGSFNQAIAFNLNNITLSHSNNTVGSLLGDFDGDGLTDILRWWVPSTYNLVWLSPGPSGNPDLLTRVTNSLGALIDTIYRPLTDNAVYTRDGGVFSYPIRDLQVPLYVVSSVSSSNGIGGNQVVNYKYTGLKAHLEVGVTPGSGLLGFRKVEATDTTDPQIPTKTVTEFRQDYPFQGLSSSVKRTHPGNAAPLSEITNTWSTTLTPNSTGKFHRADLTTIVQASNDLDGTPLPTVTTASTYNDYGNPGAIPGSITVTTTDGFSKSTANDYALPDTANWLVGLLSKSQVTSTAPLTGTDTRTTGFDYEPGTGLLVKEILEPGDSNLCLVTAYALDSFGNRTTATTRNCNQSTYGLGTYSEAAAPTGDAVFLPRTSSTGYDAQGRFPTSATNALGHPEQRVFDAGFGTMTSLTGPNSLSTSWTYDGFGRKSSETRADNTTTNWSYERCVALPAGTCPGFGQYRVRVTATGTPTSSTYYDSLNRPIRVETQGFDGTLVRKDSAYDNLGRVFKASRPYYAGATPVDTTFLYDILGREIQADEPTVNGFNARTKTVYSGLVTTATLGTASGPIEVLGPVTGAGMPQGVTQFKATTRNSQGQVVRLDRQVTTSPLTYKYDPFGNLVETNAGGVVTTLTYNRRGHKKTMSEPNMGNWSYDYNALGELVRQTDAKVQVSTMTYDKLGRMTSRTEAGLISKWFFDSYPTAAPEWNSSLLSGLVGSCAKGVGKLCYASADNGYRHLQTYDSLGRPQEENTLIDTAYVVRTAYVPSGIHIGKVETRTYPDNFAIKNGYNSFGYLSEVKNNADGRFFWRAQSLSAAGNLTQELLGDPSLAVLTGTRTYDAQDRLKDTVTTGTAGAALNLALTYDPVGNITGRVDGVNALTETFGYDGLNRLLSASGPGLVTRSVDYNAIGNITYKSDVGTYSYGAKPHAVASIGGTVNGITNPILSYDANGNLFSGLGRTLTYTSFNLPNTITQGSDSFQYTYSADHERVRLVVNRASGTYTTIYLNASGGSSLLYEKETQPSGTVEHRHYVNGMALVGAYITKSAYAAGEGPGMRYYHKDHLGSIVAITNDSGARIETLSYEAFGKRRFPNGTADPGNTLFGVTTERGFTEHEHLDELGLIHMNGRVYDPLLARFMTPDPGVPHPHNLQSFNRYSYARNNPLKVSDPSGFFEGGCDNYDDFWGSEDGGYGYGGGNNNWPSWSALLNQINSWIASLTAPTMSALSTGDASNSDLIGNNSPSPITPRPSTIPSPDAASAGAIAAQYFLNGAQQLGSGLGGIGNALGNRVMSGETWGDITGLFKSASTILPGMGLAECHFEGCSGVGWGLAAVGVIPGGSQTTGGLRLGLTGLTHTIARHTPGGTLNAGASTFNLGEDLYALASKASEVGPYASRGSLAWEVNAGRIVGYDVVTKSQTSTYTVITDHALNVITMHPGLPR